MSIQAVERKRRPRRIAADEAHAWARNLRLGNHMAKDVLKSAAMYVNGEGACFVGIEQLADDTDLSMDTVRKRLAWLENIGAIVRFPQWIDATGRRNGDGRGKRTTDEIRFLLDADTDEIEARANGEADPSEAPISPRPQQGLNPAQDSVSPTVALCQPSDSGEGSDSSEPEPEKIPPNPPLGGGRDDIDQELEADIRRFCQDYPAPITNLPRLRIVLQAMHGDERKRLILAIKGYAALIQDCERRGKPRAVKDADRWVASGMWQGYVDAGEKVQSAALVSNVEPDSQGGKAWLVLHRIARAPRPLQTAAGLYLPHPLSPQILALASAPSEDQWVFIEAFKGNQVAAWNDLIAKELAGGMPRPPLIEQTRDGLRGFYAPWDWPPRKDGSISTGPPQSGLSEQDIRDFK